MLRQTKAYIIVTFGNPEETGRLMEQAHAAGVGGDGYVWIGSENTAEQSTWEHMSAELSESERNDIMRGYIGVRPFVNKTTPEYVAFQALWRQQPATLGQAGNCSQDMDDGGNLIWHRVHNSTSDAANGTEDESASYCVGLDAEYINGTGSPGLFPVMMYDAVYVVARALHGLLDEPANMVDGRDLLDAMLAQAFVGVSGNLTFDEAGDRSAGVMFEFVNHAGQARLNHVATWQADIGIRNCTAASVECHAIVWSTEGNTHPKTTYIQVGVFGALSTESAMHPSDFSVLVQSLQESRQNIIVAFGRAQDIGRLMEQAYAAGVGGQGYVWLGSDDATNSLMWESMSAELSEAEKNDIMRGYLGVRLSINTSTPEHLAFENRWTQQQATISESGECSPEEDATRAPIWRRYDADDNETTFDFCFGMDEETIRDTAMIDQYTKYTYDATCVVVQALHQVLELSGDSTGQVNGAALRQVMLEQRFLGVTGAIAFDDVGDRGLGITFAIVNHAGRSSLQVIGSWTDTDGFQECAGDDANATECDMVVWST
eukprot:gene22662-27358_t